jgi:hypothetical protein
MMIVTVTSVEVLGHYRLRLGFNDGSKRDVDLTGALHGPVFEPLADPDFFAHVRVDEERGTVAWPNGAYLDPLVLHGDVEQASSLVEQRSAEPPDPVDSLNATGMGFATLGEMYELGNMWWHRVGFRRDKLPSYQEACRRCGGTNKLLYTGAPCPDCNGTGRRPRPG